MADADPGSAAKDDLGVGDKCPNCGGTGKVGKRTYTPEEQVKGGTEYQAGSTDYYMKKYGSDVSKWPYKEK